MEILKVKDLVVNYGMIKAVKGASFCVNQGEIVALIGANGAGKTTFVRALCGLHKETAGSFLWNGNALKPKERLKRAYMVMQDVNHQLFTESVLEEILLSMKEEGEAAKQRAGEILRDLNLTELQELHPMSLSGGQKQRVAIGSAIAADRDLLLFDEPTSGLDYLHMLEVSELLKRLGREGKTVFLITHDPELLRECCNYLLFLDKGRLSWSGAWTKENTGRVNRFFSAE